MPIDVFNTTGDDTQMSIKNRIKISVGCIWLFASINSYAWPFNSKLTAYRCPTAPAANACDSNCWEIDGGKVEFRVDVKQKLVMNASFKNGSQIGSGNYENCKVFDKENWICGERSDYSISEQKMSNGIFTSSLTIFPAKIGGKLDLSYSCAK